MRRVIVSILSAFIITAGLAVNATASYDYDLDDFYGLSGDNCYDLPDYTDAESEGVIVDLTGERLDEDELDELDDILDDAAEKVGFNIGVVVTDYIPGAVRNYSGSQNYQEYEVEEYAYECFDIMFGERDQADGVLLLINYYTLYDQIWADGEAEIYINDARTQKIFDAIEPAMLDYDTYAEAEGFAAQVIRMYKKGDARKDGAFSGGLIGLVIGLIIAVIVYFSNKSSYSKYPKTAANTYVDRSNTNFTDKQDRFIRQYTTRVRNSSSSGGGGGGRSGGGGGRSGGGRGR
ncbi:MAG: TPM domain-containing protein [Oscillospiraceae bacterium]|nr:TPM domain-containing protein [Oscillospiraceae bacterium]